MMKSWRATKTNSRKSTFDVIKEEEEQHPPATLEQLEKQKFELQLSIRELRRQYEEKRSREGVSSTTQLQQRQHYNDETPIKDNRTPQFFRRRPPPIHLENVYSSDGTTTQVVPPSHCTHAMKKNRKKTRGDYNNIPLSPTSMSPSLSQGISKKAPTSLTSITSTQPPPPPPPSTSNRHILVHRSQKFMMQGNPEDQDSGSSSASHYFLTKGSSDSSNGVGEDDVSMASSRVFFNSSSSRKEDRSTSTSSGSSASNQLAFSGKRPDSLSTASSMLYGVAVISSIDEGGRDGDDEHSGGSDKATTSSNPEPSNTNGGMKHYQIIGTTTITKTVQPKFKYPKSCHGSASSRDDDEQTKRDTSANSNDGNSTTTTNNPRTKFQVSNNSSSSKEVGRPQITSGLRRTASIGLDPLAQPIRASKHTHDPSAWPSTRFEI